jgi:hypothetical protein
MADWCASPVAASAVWLWARSILLSGKAANALGMQNTVITSQGGAGKMSANQFYGWFDDANGDPTYDPPHDAPCPFCGGRIADDDVRTHSLIAPSEYAARSYFYRTHRTCAETDPTHTAMDGFILGMIKRNGD